LPLNAILKLSLFATINGVHKRKLGKPRCVFSVSLRFLIGVLDSGA
jgi:hypothetical protein